MTDIFNFFPCEINTDIFSRLPVDSILECKLVNKTWQSNIDKFLINDPYFADMHTRRSMPSPNAAAVAASSYCSFLGREKQPVFPDRVLLKEPHSDWKIVGSCNGLICLLKDYISLDSIHNGVCPVSPVFYICNPVTREYTNLPPIADPYINQPIPQTRGILPVPWQTRCCVATGLGYIASSNQYKFVRITFDREKFYVCIYKLGSFTWSIKEYEVEYWLFINKNRKEAVGLCYNGVIYWNRLCFGVIILFDLETNEFRRIRAPSASLTGEMLVFREHLHLISSKQDGSVPIWKMNKEEEVFTRIEKLEIVQTMGNHGTDFEIEEKTVLGYDYVKYFCYPRRRSLDHVGIVKSSEMIPYMRSLVSLKATGESVNVVQRRGEEEGEAEK